MKTYAPSCSNIFSHIVETTPPISQWKRFRQSHSCLQFIPFPTRPPQTLPRGRLPIYPFVGHHQSSQHHPVA